MILKVLQQIVQEVSSAKNLNDAFALLVRRVKQAVNTKTASIYLVNYHHAEYVLAATDGLNQEAIGRIRVPLNQGLLGVIGRREELLHLNDAPSHAEFFHHPDAGEELLHAFLGVPLIYGRRLYGILTIQQENKSYFDESEEAFLVTIGAQLGSVLAHAEATNALEEFIEAFSGEKTSIEGKLLVGLPCAAGIGIGQGVVIHLQEKGEAIPELAAEDSDAEIQAFREAVKKTREDILCLDKKLEQVLNTEERSLFDVYINLLSGGSLLSETERLIREEKIQAQSALHHVMQRYVQQFESMEDEYLRERSTDFRDLGRRILSHLREDYAECKEYPENTILIGEEITATMLADVPSEHLKGILSSKGSSNSHIAILARALNIPTIMGIRSLPLKYMNGQVIVVDGYSGQAHVEPTSEQLESFYILQKEEKALNQKMATLKDSPTQTLDGHTVQLCVNTGLAVDITASLSVGADGVGLYRSEMPFMVRDCFPSEEEQRVIYEKLLNAFAPRFVTMRTLDIGADKSLPYFPIQEENPSLGWRGIRVTLDHPDVFLMQMRAMLKASVGLDNLQILFPMISGVAELDEALQLFEKAFHEIIEEGYRVVRPKIGAMIEVPSATYQILEIAKRVDFLSVGSNDLTQYLLAVDRNNPRVAGLYDSLHPAVLRCLMSVVKSAKEAKTHISICGEMAANPAMAIVLLGMGFDALSVNSSSLARVKWLICNFTFQEAQLALQKVLLMENGIVIRNYLERILQQAGLGNLLRL